MSIGADSYIGPEVLTLAIPLGTLVRGPPLGLLPAPLVPVTPGTADARSPDGVATLRHSLAIGALVLFVLCLAPPLATSARRYEVVEALQFSLLAVVVPALLVAGAPWRLLGLAGAGLPEAEEDVVLVSTASLRPVDRLALGRRRHPEPWRAGAFAALGVGGTILWRIPLTVDALPGHPWLVGVEAATLVAVETALWLELIESPPLRPRLSRPQRVALAAVAMWVIWITAYLVGLSHGAWYTGYDHVAGQGLSVSADQQLTSGLLWVVSGCAFVPVVFWNLVRWLQSEEDPDDELFRLVRQERTRGRPVEPGAGPKGRDSGAAAR